jgi:glycerol-3-phosphate dehydrogenase
MLVFEKYAENRHRILVADRTESRVHFMVPYSRNERYIGRDPKVGRIPEKLAQQKNSGHRRLAMYGLGGVGYGNPFL